MRTITETKNIYKYEELSEEAKETVKQWYLNDEFRTQDFEEITLEELHELFKNSKLKVQFSLNSCQGDGLNIYGKLNLMNVFSAIRNTENKELFEKYNYKFSEYEQKTIEAYMKVCGNEIELPYNSRYCYCVADEINFANEWIEELQYCDYSNIKFDIIEKMESLIIEIFETLSSTYEKIGYDYFYEVDEEELKDACEANEWEFLKDGTLY
jgi:hypothetical protein